MIDNIKSELARLLEVELQDLNSESALDSFENWDSLTKVSLVALVQEYTGAILEPDDIERLATVGDIVSIISASQVPVAS